MQVIFFLFITLAIVQWYFKMKQTKVLHTNYSKLLESGNVLVERSKGIFSGAVIMLQLDEEANITDCLLMSGATFMSSWGKFEELINENLLSLKEEDFSEFKKPVRKVIAKAIQSYRKSIEEELQIN